MTSSQELKSAIERIRSTPFPDNERAVEIKVILPLLGALGWDVHGAEVRYQYKVSGTRSRSQGVVDIALLGARGALCFIEAKNTDERLDNHVSQLLGYAFYEGVVLCALTNGREWWLYLPREGGKPETRKFAQMNLETDSSDDLAEQMRLFLAKNNLESGQAERAGKERLLGSRERDIWKQMLEGPHRGLVQTITDHIEQETGTRPSQSRVAALLSETSFGAAVLKGEASLGGGVGGGEKSETAPPSTSSVAASAASTAVKRERRPSRKIFGVRIWGEYREVKNWVAAYVMLANELYKRNTEDFYNRVEALGRGKASKYPWFSYEEEACSVFASPAKHLEASNPRIFVRVHGSIDALVRKIERLLEVFGYSSDDTNVWETVTE